jgi:filamentous hemagglutinin family protein
MKFLTVSLCLFSVMLGTSIAQAQIKPDNTLGVDRSILNNSLIQGGAQRGTNLFHSFTDFSIGAGERIDFANPTGVKNIITRVTDTPSNINGTLGVLGKANLFFINPNGISFGANARLDMGGTFIGSTASGVKFADGNIYSAVNPQAPLLTMIIPVGLQFGSQPGKIDFTASTSLLTNYGGSSFVLAGGDITLTSSKLILPNGKIEMVAVNDVGSIDIDPNKLTDPKSSSITIPTNLKRADIVIQNGSRLNTSDTNDTSSGNIDLQAANITISGTTISDRSVINAQSNGNNNSQSGNVNLNATGDVLISGDFSGITTSTLGSINGGNIRISGENLIILDGAYLETSPYGGSSGNGGNISISTTKSVRLGAPTNGQESDIITGTYSKGNSGNISIETGKLIQHDGSQILTDNLGIKNRNATGKLGDIKIVAREYVEVSGVSPNVFQYGFPKATSISSFSTSEQNAGNIDIQTPKFVLKDGAVIAGGTETSLGGTISITGLNGRNAESVELVSNSNLGQFLGTENVGIGNGSRIRSITSDSGNAGNINIKADRVSLQGGSRIDVRTLTSGAGGSIDIQAKTVELVNGGQLISTTNGSGEAGKINVRADNILNLNSIDSTFEAKLTFLSFITVINKETAARKALNDYLQNPNSTSQQLVFDYWQQINNNIPDRQILARYFTFLQDNKTARDTLKSFLTNTAGQEPLVDGYNIMLNVGNSSGIVSRSQSDYAGNGGNINVISPIKSTGNSGNINIISPTINIKDGATITASSDGSGRGGNIMAKAESIELNRGSITAKTLSANGGEIDLTFNKLLLMRNQSEISASATTNGNGGNIRIAAPQGVIFAVPNENSDIVASAVGGRGGKVEISASSVLGFSYQSIPQSGGFCEGRGCANANDRFSNIAATSTFGSQGIVTITTLETEPNRGIQAEPVAPGAPNLSQVCPGDFPKGRLRQRNPLASTLMDSGNGGAAPKMRQVLRSEDLWTDGRMRDTVVNMPSTAPTIEVAQGWIVGNNRTVVLTSQANGTNAVNQPAGLNCYAP